MRIKRVVGAIFWILLGCMSGPVRAADVPLPADLKVVVPDNTIPPGVVGFSGKWVGVWSNQNPHVLVVSKIHPADAKGHHRAEVIYAWGANPEQRTIPGGFKGYTGVIKNGELLVEGPMFSVVYYLSNDRRTLKGKWRGHTPYGSTDVDGTFQKEAQ